MKAKEELRQEERSHIFARALYFLFGRRLASTEDRRRQIGVLAGIPILGLDALSSAAYGPEAALTLLIPLGAAGLGYIRPITLIIVILLFLVAASYRQTIPAYPGGGGSYTVAKENLGPRWGLLAGAALSVDYILNVAVGISSGVAAVASAFPPLLPYTLYLCLGLLTLLTLLNLRGLREVGAAFMLPTYLFIACLLTALGIGIVKAFLHGGHPAPVVRPPLMSPPHESVTLWLLVRSFANGCTAMTGVEAVSNAVPIFREPRTRNAKCTLTVIITILVLMLLGIAHLCQTYHIGATEPGSRGYQSILSQLLGAVAGRNWFYYLSIAAIFSVLALSANTSFADFPRVCRLMALDQYLPEAFARRGRRLVYTGGIFVLATLATVLLVVFRGITNDLIPLFAIGALLSFSLSQAGMVGHWWRRLGERHARFSLVINAAGAIATSVTLAVVMVSKFLEGAWITLLLVPLMMWLLYRVQLHHRRLQMALSERAPFNFHGLKPPVVAVPVSGWTRVEEKALRFATQLSPEVYAVQVLKQEVPDENMTEKWHEMVEEPAQAAGLVPPRLTVIRSGYREVIAPIIDFVQELTRQHPDRIIAVVVPEVVERHWYHLFLGYATVLKGMLLLKGNQRIVVITTPWYARWRRFRYRGFSALAQGSGA